MTSSRFVDGRTLRPRVWWPVGSVGTRRRVKPYRIYVWHWSAGNRGVDGIGIDETLHNRKLSIHDVIEKSGRVVFVSDPKTTIAFHAGRANTASRGGEIVGGPWDDFTPEQYEAIGELADSLTIPRRIWMPGDDLATFSGHMEHMDVPVPPPKPGKRRHVKIDCHGRVKAFLKKRWNL